MTDSRSVDRFNGMARTAELVNTTSSPEQVLSEVMDLAIRTVRAERGFIMLIDPETGELTFRVARNFKDGSEELGLSRTLVRDVYRTQQPYFSLDVSSDAQYREVVSVRVHALRAVICVPLGVRGRRVGVIYLDNRVRRGAFEPEDLHFAVAFSHQAAIALDQALLSSLAAEHAGEVQRDRRVAVGTLAAGVAHEINNPLGTILANAQMMAADNHRAEERESIELIVNGARRAKRVIDRLLTYFRAGTEDEVTRFDLLEAAQELVEMSGVEAAVEGDEGLRVRQNRSHLAQILEALLDNARLAVASLPTPHIVVRVSPPATVEVFDNGPGMAPDVLRHIFDPFFTTRPPGQGQGLGLFVARGLAERTGGFLTATSTEGRGSRFCLEWVER